MFTYVENRKLFSTYIRMYIYIYNFFLFNDFRFFLNFKSESEQFIQLLSINKFFVITIYFKFKVNSLSLIKRKFPDTLNKLILFLQIKNY